MLNQSDHNASEKEIIDFATCQLTKYWTVTAVLFLAIYYMVPKLADLFTLFVFFWSYNINIPSTQSYNNEQLLALKKYYYHNSLCIKIECKGTYQI